MHPRDGAKTMGDCMDLLAAGEVEAVLYDKPMLDYYIKKPVQILQTLSSDCGSAFHS